MHEYYLCYTVYLQSIQFVKKMLIHKYKQYYSESQIYEFIARVFNNVVFLTYLGSNAAGNEFNILIAFLHISGLLIYLELKI